ncbi:hypothetical protein [Aureitalea marina]|uniref:Selenophosphate synthetase n=1 Tax=Aureitalea marina TaxID=930804 RepID=A0A2S7KTG8_9FLAO|nr:hypothetical protein [Aureitalea marina]PQB05910.1 hypothetical protein BST85_01675 [Aureitalea marina]
MKKTALLLCLLAVIFSCKNSSSEETEKQEDVKSTELVQEQEMTPAMAIAKAHGYDNWQNVNRLDFTFNIDRGEMHIERSFNWYPKEDRVTFINEADTVDYVRSQVDSLSLRADQTFVNDSFWLLAPLHLVWDEGTTISEPSQEAAPISGGMMNKLTLTYSDEGGYTPGDAYDFYYGDDFLLTEWVFRKGNQPEPSMVTTWEAYKEVGELTMATMHKDSTKTLQLHFTGLKVQ